MKKEQSNIDKLVREKLEHMPVEPPSHVWDGVQGQLRAVRRKRMIAFYSRIAAAAVIVIAFLAGWFFNERTESRQPEMVQNEPVTEKPNQQVLAEENEREDSTASASDELHEEKELLLAAQNEKDLNDREDEEQTATNVGEIAENNGRQVELDAREKQVALKSIDNLRARIPDSNDLPQTTKIKQSADSHFTLTNEDFRVIAMNVDARETQSVNGSGWKMGLTISPGYSYHESNHSGTYAQNMTYQPSEADANIGGGIAVQYKTGGRWSVESGLYYAKDGSKSGSAGEFLSYINTSGAYSDALLSTIGNSFNSTVRVADNHVAMNSIAGVIELKGVPEGAYLATSAEEEALTSNTLVTNGSFNQVFEFVEIPLYLRYLVVDSKIDVEVLGGLNAAVTVGNTAFLENNNQIQDVGKTRDISPVNMSGTLGVGINYPFGDKLSVAVEPRFNYYLNSINKNPDVVYRPYRVGVYTGLYYDF